MDTRRPFDIKLSAEANRQVALLLGHLTLALGYTPELQGACCRGGWIRIWAEVDFRPRELWVPREHWRAAQRGPLPKGLRELLDMDA